MGTLTTPNQKQPLNALGFNGCSEFCLYLLQSLFLGLGFLIQGQKPLQVTHALLNIFLEVRQLVSTRLRNGIDLLFRPSVAILPIGSDPPLALHFLQLPINDGCVQAVVRDQVIEPVQDP